ncbi:MAG: glycine zipper domain-containing protein [Planctomycetaceae bacterium]
MKHFNPDRIFFPSSLLVLLLVTGCQGTGYHATKGTAIGTGLGTIAGAIIGHQSGNGVGGAILGAATGAVAGNMIGDVEDAEEERDAAIAQAEYMNSVDKGLTNYDLIRMTQSGMSDEVIITAVETRGGRFRLDPDSLIYLKSNGVSDGVLLAVQKASAGVPPPAHTTVIHAAPRREYVVVPRATVGVVYAPHLHRRHRHHHHW